MSINNLPALKVVWHKQLSYHIHCDRYNCVCLCTPRFMRKYSISSMDAGAKMRKHIKKYFFIHLQRLVRMKYSSKTNQIELIKASSCTLLSFWGKIYQTQIDRCILIHTADLVWYERWFSANLFSTTHTICISELSPLFVQRQQIKNIIKKENSVGNDLESML